MGFFLLIFYTYAAVSLDVLFSFLEGLGKQKTHQFSYSLSG